MTSGSSGRHSTLVAAGILVSRLTGLVRERAVAHFLGVGTVTDAYTIAVRIPGLVNRMLGEGALSASFIPVYSRLLAQGRTEAAGRVVGAVAGLLAVAAGVIALLGVVAARPLTAVLAPGLTASPDAFELTVSLVRIMFPVVALALLSAWCLGILNSHGRFFLSYAAPALVNVVQVGVLVVAGSVAVTASTTGSLDAVEEDLAVWLAVGTLVGGGVQLLVQLLAVRRLLGAVRPSLDRRLPEVRTVLRNLVPVAASRGVIHLSVYVNLVMASFLAAGALSALRYSQVLYALPVALFGISVAAAELPRLAASRATGPRPETELRAALTRIAVFVVPTTFGYLLLGDVVVEALFLTGEFDAAAATAVWVVLGAYATGLLPSATSRLLQADLYASGDTRTPSRVAVVRVVVTAVAGLVLMLQGEQLVVGDGSVALDGTLPAWELPAPSGTGSALRLGAAGLALGAAAGAWVEYLLLRRALRRRGSRGDLAGGRARPIVAAALVATLAASVLRPLVDGLPAVVAGVVVVGVCAVVYAVAAHLFGVREVTRLLQRARRRVGGSRPGGG